MPQIRPVSDLRNNFAEISKIVHETREPVFLTKNGHGDMVVMSIEQYEHMQHNTEIFAKLQEAESEANNSDVRYSHDEVFNQLRQRIRKGDEI
ncbi:type II toxin-antitoxin system Phd/YefM family antitoxin [Cohnella sp. REN36]|uniref:type II toxin-antitoxin system Phd/YefM family antitoxin n=1 Tax=Cohnella sp. REN36 TaxID=2887347 RepID=UPI001D14C086|nr:type II toxin-antitoxin system Phd/YefM family antitoxin [Cohnella sp. REN36]MCC3372254.1 type II toxin-antitoxin system Phd/YefM family antitoxin [Cohnella sp. REN36]